ncbi:hypothetical protein Tco_0562041 [Tanacetum coccineum]
MNPRCSALLQNKLPPKEEDPRSFILPCSIGRLDFNNALADLGASISIMPFSMYKRLGMGKLELINMVIEMADNTKIIPKGIVKNLVIKIDKFIFPVEFVILDMIEDFRMPIILGRPLLATSHAKVDIFRKSISLEGSYKEAYTNKEKFEEYETVEQCLNPAEKRAHWCEALSQEKEGLRKYWASCDPHNDICDGGGLPNDVKRLYWESINDNELVDLEWEELSFNNWERKCKLLGIIYKEPPPSLIEKIEVTRYNIGPGEIYTGTKFLGIDKIPRTSTNVATVRAVIIDELGADGSIQEATGNEVARKALNGNSSHVAIMTLYKLKNTHQFCKGHDNSFEDKGGESSKKKGACYNFRIEWHFASECRKPKENKAFIGGAWYDSEDGDEQLNDATCLMAIDSQEVVSKPSSSNIDLNIIDLQKENEELLKFNKDFTKTFKRKTCSRR